MIREVLQVIFRKIQFMKNHTAHKAATSENYVQLLCKLIKMY